MSDAKGGKKGRKFGRSKRGGSMARYNAESRWTTNAKKRIARHKKAVEAKKANPPKVPRGSARASRRAGTPQHYS